MRKRLIARIIAAVLLVVVCWAGLLVQHAMSKVVTLRVRNANLRDVVHKIEKQTWETIPVHQDLNGRKVSLEVLGLIAEQVRARSLVLQPLYSSRESLEGFLRAARGEAEPANVGWSNLNAVIHPPQTAPPRQAPTPEMPMTVQLTNRDLRLAVLVFARLAQVQVVPEDGAPNKITLQLNGLSRKAAAEKLAETVQRKTKSYFSLLPGGGPGFGPPGFGPPGVGSGPDFAPPGFGGSDFGPPSPGGPPGGPGGPGPGGFGPPGAGGPGPRGPGGPGGLGPPGMMPNPEAAGGPLSPGAGTPPSREMREQMEQDYQDLLSVLPKEEVARLETERSLQNAMEHSMPEGRQSYGVQMGQLFQQRRQNLLQTTVEERVEEDRSNRQKGAASSK